MAYDTSNIPGALQYAQQQQQQQYTPANGAYGLPSKGWDGWNGYTAPPVNQGSGMTGGNGIGTPPLNTGGGGAGGSGYAPLPGVTQTSTPYNYAPGGPASTPGGYQSPSDSGFRQVSGQPNGAMGSGSYNPLTSSRATGSLAGGLTWNQINQLRQNPESAIGTQYAGGNVGGSVNLGTGAPLNWTLQKYLSSNGLTMQDLLASSHASRQAAWDANNKTQGGYAQGYGSRFGGNGPNTAGGGLNPAAYGTAPLGGVDPQASHGYGGGIVQGPIMNDPGPMIPAGPTMYDPGPNPLGPKGQPFSYGPYNPPNRQY